MAYIFTFLVVSFIEILQQKLEDVCRKKPYFNPEMDSEIQAKENFLQEKKR
jgi:hypothetical protein